MAAEPYDWQKQAQTPTNPFQTSGQPQAQTTAQPTGQPAFGATVNTGQPTGSTYNSYAPQTAQPQAQANWYQQPSAPQNWSYPQSGNYTNPSQPAWSAPQGPQGSAGGGAASGVQSAAQSIAQAYQQYLGRSASQQEIQQQLAQPNLQTQLRSIQTSPEAQAYQQRPQQGGGVVPPGYGGMPPQQQVNARNWNTDGYARPAYIAPKYAGHPMPGWDRAKWADPNHQTPKYVIGRILSGFKPRTENMDRVVAEIAKAYPGTRRTGSGDITIPGIGSTDILQAADVGGKGWRFGGTSGKQQQALTPGAQQVQNTAMDPYTQLLQSLIQPPQGQQMPQQPAAAQEPSAEMMAMQQQMQSMWQELQAAKQQQQRTSPQFSYF